MKRKPHPVAAGLPHGGQGAACLRSNGLAGAHHPASRPAGASRPSGPPGTLAGSIGWGWGAALLVALLCSYWPTLNGLWRTWQNSDDYSGGKVVPLIAAYLIWSQRRELAQLPVRTCWWGLGVLLFAQLMRMAAVLMGYGSFEQYSLVLSIAGCVLLVLGWPAALRLKWLLAFLLLMVPLPRRLHGAIALPLQDLATASSVFGLELLGVTVTREGNVLRLSETTTIAVAEACSGLRMLTAFVVVAATLAFVVHRPVWQKVVLVLSSVGVAILANTLRLIATALVCKYAGNETAQVFFHDFAGVTMMPVAVVASVGLLFVMQWIECGRFARSSK